MSFTYNDDGLRATKTVNGVVTTYYYQGSLLIAEETNSQILVYIYDANGAPVGFKYRGVDYASGTWDTYAYEKNLQGDIVAVYDTATGNKLIAYKYNAWGVCTTSYYNSGSTTTATKNPFKYRGYYYDSNLGLYYLQSRYYDQNTCRFINADGYVSTGQGLTGYNMFAYCNNNPVMYVDPNGNASWLFWIVVCIIGLNYGAILESELATATDDVAPMDDDTFEKINEPIDETIYDIQHDMECPECGADISIHITGNEYPVGAYDYDDSKVSGADFIDVPSMGITYYDDVFDVDQYAIDATGIHGLISRLSEDRDLIYRVSPREFEEIVAQVLQDDGFDTLLTQPTRDGGRDIIATKTGINGKPVVFYVECKRYARTNKVSVDLVRALYGVQTADKVNKACLVTSSFFTRDAVAFAEDQNVMIDLVDGDALHNMIVKSAKKHRREGSRFW